VTDSIDTGALESKLRSPPGSEYRYSNLGYSLLAAIVERASGMGYEQFLARPLFAPAGMTHTGYVLPIGSGTGSRGWCSGSRTGTRPAAGTSRDSARSSPEGCRTLA
jgi:CubicO group peptidase (beta-lactamase class C family)